MQIFNLLFHLEKEKNYHSGPMRTYLRITVERAERAIGKTDDARDLNNHLNASRLKSFKARLAPLRVKRILFEMPRFLRTRNLLKLASNNGKQKASNDQA